MKVLVDHMNFVFISYHAASASLRAEGVEEITEEHLGMFYHTLLNKYNALFKTYGELIICHEGKGSLDWRREIFPDYKRNRDKAKGETSYKTLKSSFPIIEELLENYPCKQIKIDGMEADDVIFALTEEYSKTEDVVVVSTDGDLVQLLDLSDNVSVYNPIKRMFSKPKPNIIPYKAIVGDRSDNIPGLYRIGEKTFDKMLNDEVLFKEKMKNGNAEIYKKFLKIVDLKRFPNNKHKEAVLAEKKLEYNKLDAGKIEMFLYENKMADHLGRWGRDSGDISMTLVESGAANLFIAESGNSGNKTEVDDILSEFI